MSPHATEKSLTLKRQDGALIHYRLTRGPGLRPVLVLIHGMASNLTRWWEFIEKTDLSLSWDILRIDLRGHGGSSFRGRVGMEVWCSDLNAILAAEGYQQAVIAGHCLGANLALFYAAQDRERTTGLILIEPMPREGLAGALKRVQPLKPLAKVMIALIRILNGLGIFRRRLPLLDLKELDTTTREMVAREGSPEAMTKRYAKPWADLRFLPVAVYLQEFIEVSRPLHPLSEIKVPVLSLISSGRFISDPVINRRILEGLPKGRIIDVPARHWIPTECPDQMRNEIETWCRDLNPTQQGG